MNTCSSHHNACFRVWLTRLSKSIWMYSYAQQLNTAMLSTIILKGFGAGENICSYVENSHDGTDPVSFQPQLSEIASYAHSWRLAQFAVDKALNKVNIVVKSSSVPNLQHGLPFLPSLLGKLLLLTDVHQANDLCLAVTNLLFTQEVTRFCLSKSPGEYEDTVSTCRRRVRNIQLFLSRSFF